MVFSGEVESAVRARQIAICWKKFRVTCDGLIEQACRLKKSRFGVRTVAPSTPVKYARPQVEIVSGEIFRGPFFDSGFLRRRKLRLQLVGNCLGDFSLNRKHVRDIAIVSFGPKMRVGARVD